MSTQKKMVYMQKLFNPSQYRSNGLAVLTKENFARIMIESVNKAINSNEGPVKEKHVRKLLIGSFQSESGAFFWQYVPIIRLKENQIVCWKFCHVLHKMIRDGHRQVLLSSYEKRQILLDCGNMWRHVEDGYGQLIFKYCTLLFNRINFLMRNSKFPNDLKVSDGQLNEIGEHNMSVFFDLSCEIFDSLDDILRLQELVLATIDLKKYNSMTSAGRCHLAPLLPCIQDSSLLYDYSVKILFKLHGSLPASTLEGHRDRFLSQHRALKSFYINASNLQYFKTLIQIPHLTEKPPNFLIASDLQQHVTPKVVMFTSPERDSPESQQLSYQSGSLNNSGDNNNTELLVNFNDETQLPGVSGSAQGVADGIVSIDDLSLDVMHNLQSESDSTYLESISNLKITNAELMDKIVSLEMSVTDLKNELEMEKTLHSETKLKYEKELDDTRQSHDESLKQLNIEAKKAKDELVSFKYQMNSSKVELEKLREDCKRAEHDNMISQETMKKLVKDMSALKSENAKLHLSTPTSVPSLKIAERNKADEQLIEELNKKVNELTLQLSERNDQFELWSQERKHLLTTKERLEQQLDDNQEDLLVAEMKETDKIIKEATKKIEELSENSRKLETGIKLQVNEKISEVCSNLMKAVRNLIIQSRLLQREVVGTNDDGTTAVLNSAQFYKRNSSWTEGLTSAANVVAMAAKSLVDAADRTMSGQAKFSELAAAAHEVAAATTQLVVASRVKANKDSEKLKILTSAAKQVTQCTGNIVDTARVCADLIEQEIDRIDISQLSLHQTKKLEMETQVRLLELEDKLTKERLKLGLLRRQHYEQEDAQAATSSQAQPTAQE